MMKFLKLSCKRPKYDGYYIVMYGGFTYSMGNDRDLKPKVAYWNGGRGCFDEDYGNKDYLYWTEIPDDERFDFLVK